MWQSESGRYRAWSGRAAGKKNPSSLRSPDRGVAVQHGGYPPTPLLGDPAIAALVLLVSTMFVANVNMRKWRRRLKMSPLTLRSTVIEAHRQHVGVKSAAPTRSRQKIVHTGQSCRCWETRPA